MAMQLAFTISAQTPTLIYKETFEFGSIFYNTTKFWSTDQALTDYTTDPSFVISSRKSLKYQLTNLSSPRPGKPAAEQIPGWRDLGGTSGNKMDLSAGKTVTMRINFKLVNVNSLVFKIRDIDAGDPVRCFVKIDLNGTTPEMIAAENPAATSPTKKSLTNHSGYSTLEFTYTAGDKNTYLFMSANGTVAGSSAVVLDDYIVCEGDSIAAETTGSELLLTDNFENGLHIFSPWMTTAVPSQAVSHLTSVNNEVINGSYSLIGGWDYNPLDTSSIEWCAIAATRDKILNIEASTRYTIRFRYKIVKPAGSFFYCMLDSSQAAEDVYLGFNDTGVREDFVNNAVACDIVNGDGFKEMTLTLDSAATAKGYLGLTFGAKGGGALIIDDVSVFKGLASSSSPIIKKVAISAPKLLVSTGFETGTLGKYFYSEPLKNTDAVVVNDMASKINGYCSALLYARNDREWSEILKYNNDPNKQGIPFKALRTTCSKFMDF